MPISIFGLFHIGKLKENEVLVDDPPYVAYAEFDPHSPGFKKLKNFVCPDCGCARFWEGPSGGMSTNYACSACRHCFNLTFFGDGLLSAQRIRVGEEPDENGRLPDTRKKSEEAPATTPDAYGI